MKYYFSILFLLSVLSSLAQGLNEEEQAFIDSVFSQRINSSKFGQYEEYLLNENLRDGYESMQEYVDSLSERRIGWRSYRPALYIANYVTKCKEAEITPRINLTNKLIRDIIFQYKNPYGDGYGKKSHKSICLGAIGKIGTPFALDFFFKAALEDEDFNNWDVLKSITDERVISLALSKYDMKNQQHGFSIIRAFSNIGTEEIVPYFAWLLVTKDRSVQRFVIEAMKELGSKKSIKPLKSYLKHPIADSLNFSLVKDAIRTLSTRNKDGIWTPYPLSSKEKKDIISMYHEMTFDGENFDYLFTFKPEFRSFFVKIGKKGLPILRDKLSTLAHTDGTKTWYYETENVAKLMVEIGSESIPYFIDALNDQYYHVREISAQSLGELTGMTFGLNYEKWKDWYLKNK